VSTGVGEYVSFNEDTTAYRLGLGRRFNDNWSGAVTLTHERGDGLTTTLLAPTDGITAIGLASCRTQPSPALARSSTTTMSSAQVFA